MSIFHNITNRLNFRRLHSPLRMDELMKKKNTCRIGRSAVVLALLGLVLGLSSTAMATLFPGASVEPVVWLDASEGVTTGDTFTWAD